MKKDLFEGEGEANVKIQVNEAYARRFEHNKKREERHRLEAKAAELGYDLDESSSSESEDSEAELLTAKKDSEILRTLNLIKSKDNSIYDKESVFYSKDDEGDTGTKQKKNKPMYLHDYEKKVMLQTEGHGYDSNDEDAHDGPSHVQEQEDLRQSLLAQVQAEEARVEGDVDDDGLLVLREKSEEQKAQESREHEAWLKERETYLEKYFQDQKKEEDDKFLYEYLRNEGWLDKDGARLPTYNEVVNEGVDQEEYDDDEDEHHVERQEAFEHKYNFRFEEPGGNKIVSHSRNVEGTIRRTDDKRKEKRKEREERKKKEKIKKKEELLRLKQLKRAEILERLKKIQDIAGNTNVGFDEVDLEGDFDPSQFDEKMDQVFGDEYYNEEEDLKKPVFDDGLSDLENEGDYDGDYDDDYERDDSTFDNYGEDDNESKSELSDLKKQQRDKFMEEMFKVDYEDIIGDMPVRFKYRKVLPNAYGMTTEDILNIDEKDLNQYISIKKLAPYREREYKPRSKLVPEALRNRTDGMGDGEEKKKKKRATKEEKRQKKNKATADAARKEEEKMKKKQKKAEKKGKREQKKKEYEMEKKESEKKESEKKDERESKDEKGKKVKNAAKSKLSKSRMASYMAATPGYVKELDEKKGKKRKRSSHSKH